MGKFLDLTFSRKEEAEKQAKKRRKEGLRVRIIPFKRKGFKTRHSVFILGSRKR